VPEVISYLTDYAINSSLGLKYEKELENFVETLCLYFGNESSIHKRVQFTVTLIEKIVN
jgi:hypothetical protein